MRTLLRLCRALAVTSAALIVSSVAQGIDIPETEPNETKAQAANQTIFMHAGDSIVGVTTGTSTTTPGLASADTFRVCPVVDPPNPIPAKYCWRLVLRTQTPGHTLTIRGLSQSAGVVNPTSDVTFQTGRTVTTPENLRIIQWYSFGRPAEDVFVRVTGSATTTASYSITLECVRVLFPDEPPQPGVPQIVRLGGATGVIPAGIIRVFPDAATDTALDTDWVLFDQNFNAIPGGSHDDPDGIGETFPAVNGTFTTPSLPPGRYYIAFGNFNTGSNLGSTSAAETFRTGNVLDFPGTVANSSTTVATTVTMVAENTAASTTIAGTSIRPDPFYVTWFCFEVVPPTFPTPPTCGLVLTPTSGGVGTSVIARATVTPGTNPPSSGLSATLNALSIDGGSVALLDDGVAPDAVAGDNIFSGTVTVGPAAPSCTTQTLTCVVSDLEGRSSTCTAGFGVAPPNDLCANAINAPVGSTPFCNVGANTDGSATCATSGRDVWFRHVPPVTGTIEINLCGSSFDSHLSVFTACGGTQLACNDDSADATCGTLNSRLTLDVVAGTPIIIRVAGFGSTAAGTGTLTITAASMTITSVSPPTVREGDLLTISGTGFGNNPDNLCVVIGPDPSGLLQSLRAETASGTTMTARVQRVDNRIPAGPVMVMRGQGARGTFVPIFQHVIPEDPQGVWGWNGANGAMATSAQTVILDPTPLMDPPGGVTEHVFTQFMNGRVMIIFDHPWGPNSYIRLILHIHGPGFSHDIDLGCIRIRGRGSALECASAVCDMIRCVFLQRFNININCLVEPLPGGRAKITIIFKDPNGNPIPIQQAGGFMRAFMPDPLPLPPLAITTPFFSAAQDPFPGGGVRVSNIGSSGQDGVSVDVPGIDNGLLIELVPLSLQSIPTSSIGAQAWGVLDGQPRRRLGSTSIHGNIDSFFDVFADFSDIGAPSVRAQVVSGGAVVADAIVPFGQVARVLPGPLGQPNIGGCGKRPRWPIPLPCYWWDFDRPGRFLLPGGTDAIGERLVLLASSTSSVLGAITTFDVKGGDLLNNSFVISGAAAPPADCHGECVADFDDGSGTGTPDGGVTIDDLLYYLFIFEAGVNCADVDDGSGTGTPDGGVTIDDLLYYLQRFEAGC